MAMQKKYAVNGLVEWTVLLPAGKTRVSVSFTGGASTGYGNTPATFVTGNVALQRVIESSKHFRSGRIRLLSGVRN